mgnify:CR=1 FL=1
MTPATMLALVFDGEPRVVEKATPEPPPGEALIRVTRAGICSTDRELVRGYMGFTGTLGHEFVGVVERADDAPEWLGRRVVGEINCVCGLCAHCRAGRPHHCTQRTVLGIQQRDGAFAQFTTLPIANLHAVPDSLDDDAAVFTEPVAAAFRILEQIDITPETRVAVLGDGKLGQLIARVLQTRTGQLVAVGRQAWKRALLEAAGIATASSEDDLPRDFDVVVEATGAPDGLARALSLVRCEGTVVLKTTVAEATPINLSLPVVVDEVTILGSRCGPFPPALTALTNGTVDPRPLITHRCSLGDGVAALEQATRKDALKVLLDMPS